MNKNVLGIFACLALYALPIHAASAPSDTLTVRDAVQIYNALDSLDKGGNKVIDGKEAHVPFSFSSTVRWTLSGDKSALAKIATDFESTKNATIADTAAAVKKDDPAGQAKLNAAVDKALNAVLDLPAPAVSLKKVSLADLALDTNPIDVQTLTSLRPIISDQ
jgi:hypothetical protein